MTSMSRRMRIYTTGLLLAVLAVVASVGLATTVSADRSTDLAAASASACEADGRTLSQASLAYSRTCEQPRVDCDPIDGRWICSSEVIGDAAPGIPARPSVVVVDPAPTTTGTSTPTSPTEPPTSDPTATQPPATQPPSTQAPTTQSPTTMPGHGDNDGGDHDGGDNGHSEGGHGHGPTPNLDGGLPTGSTGTSALQLVNREPDTRDIPANIATFRMDCHFSHMNFDDAIVHPGAPGNAHLHVYFGNTSVNANSDPMTLNDVGNSTCAGGRANRSAYWVPAVIDTNDGNRVLEPEGSIIYYKSGWRGGKPNQVVAPPNGLRVIAGDQSNSELSGDPYYQRNISWACTQKGSINNNRLSEAIPTDCRPGELLVVRVSFPQCWDGKNLDSADHQSHMAYLTGAPNRRQDCPASHPVHIPRMTINAYFKLGSTDTSGLRLSSDSYGMDKPGGLSAHGDWIVGWDQQILERVLDGCFRPADDCGHNNFNDGQGLRYPSR